MSLAYGRQIRSVIIFFLVILSIPHASARPADELLKDAYNRLSDFRYKLPATCPRQHARTLVILAIGQSNVANSGEGRFQSDPAEHIINMYGGKCVVAASPLLGSTGEGGEYLTLLGKKLIQSGRYTSVVLIPAGIGGSPIHTWRKDGYLWPMLTATVTDTERLYSVDLVLWHQGEQDYLMGTSEENYLTDFYSMKEGLRELGIKAPIMLVESSKCGDGWSPNNGTRQAQRRIIQNGDAVLGASPDDNLEDGDRRADRCHLAESGQEKLAGSITQAILKLRK